MLGSQICQEKHLQFQNQAPDGYVYNCTKHHFFPCVVYRTKCQFRIMTAKQICYYKKRESRSEKLPLVTRRSDEGVIFRRTRCFDFNLPILEVKMKVDNVYSSIACNRNPEAADWGHNNLVLFGACNAVAVFDPSVSVFLYSISKYLQNSLQYNSSSKIIQTFVEHTARVNCVKWIKSSMNDHVEFVSGSNDQTCILWNVENIHSNEPTISTRKLQGHVGGVTVVEAIYIGERLTIATASTDSTIKLWRQTDDNIITCVQTISLGDGLCFAIRMCRLPDTEAILMAVATDDDKIHLYCERDDSDFGEVERLIGHEDWVRGLDFIVNGKSKTFYFIEF